MCDDAYSGSACQLQVSQGSMTLLGVAAGCGAALALLLLVLWYCQRKNQGHKEEVGVYV